MVKSKLSNDSSENAADIPFKPKSIISEQKRIADGWRKLANLKESLAVLEQLLGKEIAEEEKKGNEPFMVWDIPKSVIEEFNEKIVNPKCHFLGLSQGEVFRTEVMNFMLEAIKNAKKEA